MRSANHISITMCSLADEKLIEAARCFPWLWQVSSKSYKDTRAKENAWKEVASWVTEQTANRNNTLLSCYFEYSMHLHCSSSFLSPSFIICEAKEAATLQSLCEGGVYVTLFI